MKCPLDIATLKNDDVDCLSGWTDVMAVPWLFRMTNVLTHYCGFSVPSGEKISAYLERLFEDPMVKATCSNEDLYLDSYARYAENRPNTSQVGHYRAFTRFGKTAN